MLTYTARFFFPELFADVMRVDEYFDAIAEEGLFAAGLHPHPGNRQFQEQLEDLAKQNYSHCVRVVVGYWDSGMVRKYPVSNSILVRWSPTKFESERWVQLLRCRILGVPRLFARVAQDQELKTAAGKLSYFLWDK